MSRLNRIAGALIILAIGLLIAAIPGGIAALIIEALHGSSLFATAVAVVIGAFVWVQSGLPALVLWFLVSELSWKEIRRIIGTVAQIYITLLRFILSLFSSRH